jgi:L-ascorbate metabolism protein UlaG (beta-lactamase superfamily)
MIKSKKTFLATAIVFVFICFGAADSRSTADEKQPDKGKMKFEEDIIKTDTGDLKITFIGHGTLKFVHQDKVVHVDPWSRLADYSKMVVLTKGCADKVAGGTVMKNGDVQTVGGLKIEAVPAYNIIHKRGNGQPYHPKGRGNGYIVTFGKTRVYVAGDTENIPEMKEFKKINIAFLPMNLPYTMTPEMAAAAAKVFEPKILYPYHYGQTDPNTLVNLLKDSKTIEVRIRKMK